MKKISVLLLSLFALILVISFSLFFWKINPPPKVEKEKPLVIEIFFDIEDDQLIRQFAGSLIIKNDASDSRLFTSEDQLELYRIKHNIPKGQQLTTVLPAALYVCWDNNKQTREIYEEIRDNPIIGLINLRPLAEVGLDLDCT